MFIWPHNAPRNLTYFAHSPSSSLPLFPALPSPSYTPLSIPLTILSAAGSSIRHKQLEQRYNAKLKESPGCDAEHSIYTVCLESLDFSKHTNNLNDLPSTCYIPSFIYLFISPYQFLHVKMPDMKKIAMKGITCTRSIGSMGRAPSEYGVHLYTVNFAKKRENKYLEDDGNRYWWYWSAKNLNDDERHRKTNFSGSLWVFYSEYGYLCACLLCTCIGESLWRGLCMWCCI